MLTTIAEAISQASGRPFRVTRQQPGMGGCINIAQVLSDGRQRWFVKLNDASRVDMFVAEAEGLRELAASDSVRVPQPLCHGIAGDQAYLVMEWLDLAGTDGQERFAEQLVAMHQTSWQKFGWWRDNTIGLTAQPNAPDADWCSFWSRQRLGYQLDLVAARGNRALEEHGRRLQERLPALFAGHRPLPSLLHGDLWTGNYASTRDGAPVIYDPAVYYGDREADLAMSELFGRFSKGFYEVYQGTWPLEAGYATRKILYNLYHILNHYNMFDGGYGQQATHMIDQLLAELG